MSGVVARAAGALDQAASAIGRNADGIRFEGRPHSTWTKVSIAPLESGRPDTAMPVVATVDSHFRLGNVAADGVVELALPHESTLVMRAFNGGRKLPTTVEGTRLLVHDAVEGKLVVNTAMSSQTAPDLLRLEVDRVAVGDLAPRVVGGADIARPVPHYRTGEPQAEIGEHVIRVDESRGWELAQSSMPKAREDYVHPLDQSLQAHVAGAPDTPFTATLQYTGKVNGKTAEGAWPDLKRLTNQFGREIGAQIFHTLERLR
jgi:hypothetical protein